MPPDSLAISWLWPSEIKDLLASFGSCHTRANIELPGFIPARLEVCHHTPYASDVRVRWISRSLSTNMAGTPVGLHGRWYHAFSYSVPLTVWSFKTRLRAQRQSLRIAPSSIQHGHRAHPTRALREPGLIWMHTIQRLTPVGGSHPIPDKRKQVHSDPRIGRSHVPAPSCLRVF